MKSAIRIIAIFAAIFTAFFVAIYGAPFTYYWLTESALKSSPSEAFGLAEKKNTAFAYEQFLRDYPSGEFATLAAQRARELNQAADSKFRDFDYVSELNTRRAYSRFLELNPAALDAQKARERLIQIELDEGFPGTPLLETKHQSFGSGEGNNMTEIRIDSNFKHSARVIYAGEITGEKALPPYSEITISGPKGHYEIGVQILPSEGREIQFYRWGVAGDFVKDTYFFDLTTFGL